MPLEKSSPTKKDLIAKIVSEALKVKKLKLKQEDIAAKIETPPSPEMGDFAFPCFFLSPMLKQNPNQIAVEIREKFGNQKDFSDIQTRGPYINFFVNREEAAAETISRILNEKENFGSSQIGKGKTIVVEFSSPNIAKPFGIGHLRSTIIGNSLSKISGFNGFKTVKINYLGDWGTQFGKLIAAYKHFGDEKKLQKDPVNYLLELYVKVNATEEYDEESRSWFSKLEQGDAEALELWKRFRELSLSEFEKIYGELGIKFDVFSGESMYNDEMKSVVKQLKDRKLLKKNQGAEIVDLEKYNLGIALITKSDGSTLYITRDLAAAISRQQDYKFSRMIYEVGQEQKLHFMQVFKILELLGYEWAKDCVHVEHGLYLGSDGKKFSTRKGKTIFMEGIISDTKKLAEKELKKRKPGISKSELEEKSMKVAIASIFYGDLKNSRKNDMVFDLAKFTSFEGDTGPYLLYSYARANSILKKTLKKASPVPKIKLHEKEIELVKKLSEFPSAVSKAYETLNPAGIANYAYQLAQAFNEFYHSCPVVKSKNEHFRIALVESFIQALKNSLNLLGIETLDEM